MAVVVVIEDNTDLVTALTQELKNSGYEVYSAGSGEVGLRLIGEHNPQAVLLDVMLLGKLNGFDVLETLKREEATSKIPVIMLTNLDSEQDSARAVGANDYLVKANVQLADIVAKVREFTG